MAITTAKQTLEVLAKRFAATLGLGQSALDVVVARLTESGLEVLEQRDAAIVALVVGSACPASRGSCRRQIAEAAKGAGLIQ